MASAKQLCKVPASKSPAVETHEPKSLMNLPPELRLRIYEYVFASQHIPSESHCCSNAQLVSSEIGKQLPIKCTCSSGPHHPEILRKSRISNPPSKYIIANFKTPGVSKKIFHEAMPILYDNLELRATLPPPGTLIFLPTVLPGNLIPIVPESA
ncbi:uncharacterized protein MYCFIDRAFT_84361 [Pseudocercospora fijiensis CIRAD86]|uniref:Uncharacterized protein n=1 Tax=Pseudocercospora fijiensis (strain CIRAD86) TaxID=383855 RepID=M2YIH8_PSEFD|nr:uncharacterized protein MYCFIDRAFT_84361 [Pseudocercospora fijiensis CIRAD86]EME77580.1 hypothetical protein MYCFIDRAFT_84361 [Pseudocercospora fijiensis CIRAD86]